MPGRRAGAVSRSSPSSTTASSASSGCPRKSRWRKWQDQPAIVERFRLTGPISYKGQAAVQHDIDTLKAALDGLRRRGRVHHRRHAERRAATIATSRSSIRHARRTCTPSPTRMHEEYKAITDAGFILQLRLRGAEPARARRPHQATGATRPQARASWRIEIVNHALRDIPEERVRYHHCWGSNNRPHTTDTPLTRDLPQLLQDQGPGVRLRGGQPAPRARVDGLERLKLPDGKILIPGLISQSTNVVEHPELVAWRIKNFASVVGKENIIAGVDCGFSQYWDQIRVHPTVQWAKLQALADGAALASQKLWAGGARRSR